MQYKKEEKPNIFLFLYRFNDVIDIQIMKASSRIKDIFRIEDLGPLRCGPFESSIIDRLLIGPSVCVSLFNASF